MWDWLKGIDRRKDFRRRFEVERDRRIQRELTEGLKVRQQRERHLITELKRLEKALQRVDK